MVQMNSIYKFCFTLASILLLILVNREGQVHAMTYNSFLRRNSPGQRSDHTQFQQRDAQGCATHCKLFVVVRSLIWQVLHLLAHRMGPTFTAPSLDMQNSNTLLT